MTEFQQLFDAGGPITIKPHARRRLLDNRRQRVCEVCRRLYEPTYSKQRTCGRKCGLVLRFGERVHEPSKRDLDAPIAAERDWLERQRIQRQREYMRDYVLNLYRTNPAVRERMLSNTRRRNARLRGATLNEPISLEAIARRDGNRCHICGKKVRQHELSLDHLIPVSKGGDHVIENVALAHRRCNSRRGAGRLPAQLRLVG